MFPAPKPLLLWLVVKNNLESVETNMIYKIVYDQSVYKKKYYVLLC